MPEDLTSAFVQATEDVKRLAVAPDRALQLQLYGLYKQGTLGDCRGDRPGMMDFVARAKFDAWKALEGTPQDAAKDQYVALARSLRARDGE